MKMIFRALCVLSLAFFAVPSAAQSTCPNAISQGQVWTAAQWNSFFTCIQQKKADYPVTIVPASAITGTISASALPYPTSSTLGAVKASSAIPGQFVIGIDTEGNLLFGTPSGSGNVIGPISSVSGNLPSFSGTTGTLIQDSGVASASLLHPETYYSSNHVILASEVGNLLYMNASGGTVSFVLPRSLGTPSVPLSFNLARDPSDTSGNQILLYDCVSPSNTAPVNLIDVISAPINEGQVPTLVTRVNGSNVVSLRNGG